MMRATAEIFVIFEEPDARTRQAFLLNNLGLPFQDVDVGPAPLAGEWRLGRGITHLILPVGLNFLLLLRQVRSSFPDATVLAVGEFSAIDRRIHAYMAGADNCLSAQAGPEELAAVLQAIRRKGVARMPGVSTWPRRSPWRGPTRTAAGRASGCFRTAAGCWRPPMHAHRPAQVGAHAAAMVRAP